MQTDIDLVAEQLPLEDVMRLVGALAFGPVDFQALSKELFQQLFALEAGISLSRQTEAMFQLAKAIRGSHFHPKMNDRQNAISFTTPDGEVSINIRRLDGVNPHLFDVELRCRDEQQLGELIPGPGLQELQLLATA